MFALPAGLEAFLLSANVPVLLLAGAVFVVGAALRVGRQATTGSEVANLAERRATEPALARSSREWNRLSDRIADAQRHADQAIAMQDQASDMILAVEHELGEVASELATLMPRPQVRLNPLVQQPAISIRRRLAA